MVYGQRGKVHTFSNEGNILGRMRVFVTPAGLEKYLEGLSSLDGDMPQVLAIFAIGPERPRLTSQRFCGQTPYFFSSSATCSGFFERQVSSSHFFTSGELSFSSSW